MRNQVSCVVCLVTLVCIAGVTGLHAQTDSARATAVQQTPVTPAVLTPVPRVIWFNGAFRPADRRPVAAVETVTVAVYREREGGVAVWQETQIVTMEADGRYSLLMGSTSSDGMPLEVFTSGEPRWIGITVNRPGEAEQPRVHLASVPYALKAADTETLGGKPASAYLLAEEQKTPHASKTSADAASTLSAGTPGYLGMFVDPDDLGNSALYQSGVAIGLGTTVPRDSFHVTFTDGGGGFTGYAVQNLSSAVNAYSGMLFYDQTGATAQFQGFNNSTHEYRINNVASNGTINFMIGTSKLLIANSGNIGVGVPAPASKLDVAGDINTTTQYSIGGSRVLGVPGLQNTFAGVGAGLLTTDSRNSFFGWNAGSGSSGTFNSFFGRLAGRLNSGNSNSFFGDGIGQINTGSDNAFVGTDAGFNNTTGFRNSFMGRSAGVANQAGFDNSSFGFQAGSNNTNSCCNVFFGSFSGNNNPAGSSNTLVGYATNFGAAALTNATAIGAQAMVSQSNSLILGSIAGQNAAVADTNVGIGTTAPGSKLDVAGDINLTGMLKVRGNAMLRFASNDTSIGLGLLALNAVAPAEYNTALGTFALMATTGEENTGIGGYALSNTTSGIWNAAAGFYALGDNVNGSGNTAVGRNALGSNTSGNFNTAVGFQAGLDLTGVSDNNIDIGSPGQAGDGATIRVGTPGLHMRSFIAGVRGVTTGATNAIPVVIDSSGQLGTVSSSRRFKEDIHDMGDASRALMRLRPVTFRYKAPFDDGSKPIQYGLIAEEVAEVYPDLVAHSSDGQIETVKYQVLDAMLLNEVQQQQADIRGLHAQIRAVVQQNQAIQRQNQNLQERLASLEAALAGRR